MQKVDPDFERRVRNSSRRTMVIYIENNTNDLTLFRSSEVKEHGEWFEHEPAGLITPGSWTVFANVSAGILTGCEGEVNYLGLSSANLNNPQNQPTVVIHWDNPFVGASSTRYTVNNPGNYKILEGGGGGDVLRYFFSK